MTRLLARLRRRRGGAPAPTIGPDAGDGDHTARATVLPAGLDPEDVEDRPSTRRRSGLRKRLRYLRQARELLLRDLGGLVYETRRAGSASADALVQRKVDRIRAVDAEVSELRAALGDGGRALVVREAGVGGACPTCGEYFASDARFCSNCGAAVDGRRRAPARPQTDAVAAEATPASMAGDASSPALAPSAVGATAPGAEAVATGDDHRAPAAEEATRRDAADAAAAPTGDPAHAPAAVDPYAPPREPIARDEEFHRAELDVPREERDFASAAGAAPEPPVFADDRAGAGALWVDEQEGSWRDDDAGRPAAAEAPGAAEPGRPDESVATNPAFAADAPRTTHHPVQAAPAAGDQPVDAGPFRETERSIAAAHHAAADPQAGPAAAPAGTGSGSAGDGAFTGAPGPYDADEGDRRALEQRPTAEPRAQATDPAPDRSPADDDDPPTREITTVEERR